MNTIKLTLHWESDKPVCTVDKDESGGVLFTIFKKPNTELPVEPFFSTHYTKRLVFMPPKINMSEDEKKIPELDNKTGRMRLDQKLVVQCPDPKFPFVGHIVAVLPLGEHVYGDDKI